MPVANALRPVTGPACAFKRAAALAANEKKVFILHEEGENATAARLQTVAFAKALDNSGIVPYYRNATLKVQTDEVGVYRGSWLGKNAGEIARSVLFVRETTFKKGPFYSIFALGKSCGLAEVIAAEHNLTVQPGSDFNLPSTGDYPIVLITPSLATKFTVPIGADALTDLSLPVDALLEHIVAAIDQKKKLYDFKKPTIKDLRAIKAEKIRLQKEHMILQTALNKERKLLKERKLAGEDVVIPPKLPTPHRSVAPPAPSPETYRPIPADTYVAFQGFSVVPRSELHKLTDSVSNYVLSPTAEPVTPCSVESLEEMITWLDRNEDIIAEQEPRIDFAKGSILGKTTPGGGTSVDLCKQVVGPKGIKPILDAVGRNSHIDRFLLGNNIVGDEGAKVIADFIADTERSKRVYNFYIAGNSISSKGISLISKSLATNPYVTALWLKRNPLGPEGALHIAEMLRTNTTLTTLDLVNTGIGDAGGAAVLDALLHNPSTALRHLYLGSNAHGLETARAASAYFKSGQSKLTVFYMSASRLGDEGAAILAEGLAVDKKIERLGLSSCRIADKGAKALADALAGNPNLVHLDLGFRKGTYELGEHGNDIGDEGALYLGERLLSSGLRSLDIKNNIVTFDGQAKFVERCVRPNTRLQIIQLAQKGQTRNAQAEMECKEIGKRNRAAFDEDNSAPEEKARIKEAMYPQHIAEIYSIYRGNM